MRTRRITHVTSFSTTGEMFDAIKTVSHKLEMSASDLIRQAIEDYLRKISLKQIPTTDEKECSQKDQEDAEGSHKLLQ